MGKSENAEPRARSSRGKPAGRGCLCGFLGTSAVVALIVLAGGFFVARTDGARKMVEGAVGRNLGLTVHIERTRIAWPPAFAMEGLRSEEAAPDGGSLLQAGEVRVGIGLRPLLHWDLRDVALRLVQSRDGRWRPGGLERLGNLPAADLSELSRLTADARHQARVVIRGGSVEWVQVDGTLLAAVRDVDFRFAPVRLPDREVFYYRIAIGQAIGPDGVQVERIEREWLASEVSDYIELSRGRRERPAGQGGLWRSRG